MAEQLPLGCFPEDTDGNGRSWPLVAELLDYLRKTGAATGYLQEFPGPAKHFLVWLDRNGIGLDAVDGDVVHKFLTHDCDCPRPPGERYQQRHVLKPAFRGGASSTSCSSWKRVAGSQTRPRWTKVSGA